jgi:hypothetical protein
MRTRAAVMRLLVLAGWAALAVAQRRRTLFNNCTCLSECGYSLDSIYTAWCTTTVVNPPASQECCGKYSARMSLCWEECTLTVR